MQSRMHICFRQLISLALLPALWFILRTFGRRCQLPTLTADGRNLRYTEGAQQVLAASIGDSLGIRTSLATPLECCSRQVPRLREEVRTAQHSKSDTVQRTRGRSRKASTRAMQMHDCASPRKCIYIRHTVLRLPAEVWRSDAQMP